MRRVIYKVRIVSIRTRYGLYGSGIEFRWAVRFSAPVQTGPAAHQVSYKMGNFSLSRIKGAGVWRLTPTPSSVEVK
jgi:hypothetical protein